MFAKRGEMQITALAARQNCNRLQNEYAPREGWVQHLSEPADMWQFLV